MNNPQNQVVILIADDDEDDRIMFKDAWEESRKSNILYFVETGEELMDYLHLQGRFSDISLAPRPGLIVLDLNMPKKDGCEALKEIKNDNALRTIPVVALTTSQAEEDILRAYDLGVNSFITKPASFESLVETLNILGKYWFEIVELPYGKNRK